MSLRVTTILVIAVTTLALIGLLLLSLNATLLPHFERQQEQAIILNLQRAQNSLDGELSHLEQISRDWAKWDDTYQYVQVPASGYITANIQPETYTDLRVNLIAIFDLSGNLVYGQTVPAQGGPLQAITPELLASIQNQPLLANASALEARNGFLPSPGDLLMVTAHPILHTTGTGPAAGTFVMGRYLSADEAARLSETIQLPLEILPFNIPLNPGDAAALQALQAGEAYHVLNLNEQTSVGYFLLRDPGNQPVSLVKVEQPRTTYKNGVLLVNYLFIALFMSALTFGVILFIILEMTVLTRMRRLSQEMASIGSSGDLAQRVSVSRRDEISALSRSINQMLSDLERTQASLRSLSRRLVQVQEEERRQLALELHDEIGQILTGMKLQMQGGAQLPTEDLLNRMQRAQEMTNELIGRVRQMSLNLRPSMLDDLGLLPTLLWHFERYRVQTNIHVNFQHADLQGQRFPQEIEIAAYRVIQEALTNAARHARVDQVTVRVWRGESSLGLQIEDDGSGFSPRDILNSGDSRGLVGMRERVSALRGSLDVDSTPGRGTCITVEFPLESGQDVH